MTFTKVWRCALQIAFCHLYYSVPGPEKDFDLFTSSYLLTSLIRECRGKLVFNPGRMYGTSAMC